MVIRHRQVLPGGADELGEMLLFAGRDLMSPAILRLTAHAIVGAMHAVGIGDVIEIQELDVAHPAGLSERGPYQARLAGIARGGGIISDSAAACGDSSTSDRPR